MRKGNCRVVGNHTLFLAPCRFNKHTIIGDYCTFNGVDVSGEGDLNIGDYCQFAPEVLILTQNHNYDNGETIPYDHENIRKAVKIDDFVWIGQRATILPGTHIGEGAIIQAGSVVHGEIPRCAIAGGNPAKVFTYRDIKHFNSLKANNKVFKQD